MTERRLIEAVLKRDARAWAEFVRRYEGALRTEVQLVASGISDEDVDDVLGDLWLRLVEDDLRHIRAFAEATPDELIAWLKLLVGQLTAKYLRAQRRSAPTVEAGDDEEATQLLTPREVGERLRVSTKQAYRLIREHMKPVAVGTRMVRVERRSVEEFIRRRACLTGSGNAARSGTAGSMIAKGAASVARRSARTAAPLQALSSASSNRRPLRPVSPRLKASPPSPAHSST